MPATFRSAPSVRVGEDITVVGYPLGDLLGTTIKATAGTVSSLTGINNDSAMLQIDASVQPGNSGGPLVDSAGNVIGVVTSKLDDIEMLKQTGSLPQNVNFAIKNSSTLAFLRSQSIDYMEHETATTLSRSEIVDRASQFTVFVRCE